MWHTTMLGLATDQPSPAISLLPYGAQVLICLDEFTKDNGGTMFMPDSHKHKPEGIEADEEGTLDGTTVLEAPAGSVLIAHSAWWYVLVALYMPAVLSQMPYITMFSHMLCYIDEDIALVPLSLWSTPRYTSLCETCHGQSSLCSSSLYRHRQTKNTSGHSRTALLGNYTPGYVVPKDNMEKQWRLFRASAGYDALSRQEQEALEELLLGADKRGLYEEPLPY